MNKKMSLRNSISLALLASAATAQAQQPQPAAEADVLEEVAGTQDGVDVFLIGQLEDARERLAAVAAPEARGLGTRPGERRIEMEVGEMQDPHDSQA